MTVKLMTTKLLGLNTSLKFNRLALSTMLATSLTLGAPAWANNADTEINIETGYLQGADDNSIFYRAVSPTQGNVKETIIYLHGGPGFDMNDGGLEFDYLADKYQFIAFDQRGGGYSEPVDDLSAQRMVEDIEKIRQHFGLEKFTIMGQSWGSGLSMMYANAYPDKLNKMILISPMPIREAMWNYRFAQTGKLLTDAQNQAFFAAATADLSNATREEVIANCQIYIPLVFVPYLSPISDWANMKGDYCNSDTEGMKARWGNNAATMASIPGFDWREAATEFDVPTYVFDGEWSMVPLNTTREWGGYLPNSRVEIMKDAGHLVWLDNPRKVERSLRKFLKGKWPRGARRLNPTHLDLLSRYQFNQSAVNDMDNRFHGQIIGNVTFGTDRRGRHHSTAQFSDGVASINVPAPTWSAEPKNWTWAGWINLGNFPANDRTLLTQGDSVKLDTDGGKLRFSVAGIAVTDDTSITAKTWAHVTVVQDGDNIRLYRNGELAAEATGTDLPALAGDFVMQNTTGALDEVRVYAGSLDDDRVKAVYRARR